VRHVLKRHRGAIAIPAAMALTLMACEADDNGDASPGIEEGEQDEQALLPEGAFGEQCQELLVAADVDGVGTGVAEDGADDDAFDEDAGADDGVGADDDTGVQDDEAFDDGADGGEDPELETEPDADGDTGTDEDEATDDEFAYSLAATETDDQGDLEDDDFETDAEDDGLDDDFETDAEDDGLDDDAGTDTDGAEDALRQMTVLEALEALPDFDRFTEELAGTLETEIDGEGNITVFAPLDEAFEEDDAFGEDDGFEDDDALEDDATADDTATDDTATDDAATDDTATGDADDLAGGVDRPIDERVIAYHLHPQAALLAQQLVDDESVSTAADDAGDLRITADGDVLSVDADESTAQVVCANIETQDGVIHVIDEILLPREDDGGTEGDLDAENDLDAEADDGAEADGGLDTEDGPDAEADGGADAEGDLDTGAEDDGFEDDDLDS
jgi:large repetitive protein